MRTNNRTTVGTFIKERRPCNWARRVAHADDEQGDVPGWVMITVMSAGLVAVLTAVAGPALRQMLVQALSAVGG